MSSQKKKLYKACFIRVNSAPVQCAVILVEILASALFKSEESFSMSDTNKEELSNNQEFDGKPIGGSGWTHQDFESMRKDWGNNSLVGWKLFYTDGSTITSAEMSFNDAPQNGIQVLIKYYKREKGGYSREVQNGLDLYVLYSDQAEQLDLPPDIKKGENLTNQRFEELLALARADTEIVTEM